MTNKTIALIFLVLSVVCFTYAVARGNAYALIFSAPCLVLSSLVYGREVIG